jgi:glyoxylase-like metal-dependent hydrolase (beta-lactamase superfamily II)
MGAGFTEVAPGVLRMGTAVINWYLVADDTGVTLVDAGAPAYRKQLEPGLAQLGRTLDDVRAVVLTHGDADHKGFAEPLRAEHGVRVYVHSADAELTRGVSDKVREQSFLPYLRHRAAWRTLAEFVRGGRPAGVEEVVTFEDGDVLEVPGRPRVVQVPGHTAGSVAFDFRSHQALFVGDAIMHWNVLTGRTGPQISPAALNESSEQALSSLDLLEGLNAETVLSGHGDPWTDGVPAALAAARAAGLS